MDIIAKMEKKIAAWLTLQMGKLGPIHVVLWPDRKQAIDHMEAVKTKAPTAKFRLVPVNSVFGFSKDGVR